MDPDLLMRLLVSLEANRLVAICGAGLSMAPPSSLPSAEKVANRSFDKCIASIDPKLPIALRSDLEAFAEHFAQKKALNTAFMDVLVDWTMFVRPPNEGHSAIADFLTCRAFFAVLTSNYDCLIEERARFYGVDFLASLDGDEANDRATHHSPLLKFHGCATRSRKQTVWTKSQLTDDPAIAARIANIQAWLTPNLRGKDWLFIGFWTDWAYLNKVLADALKDVNRPTSVTVIDLQDKAALAAKAPELWAVANGSSVAFSHVQMSGAKFLDKLRLEFSHRYARKFLSFGRAQHEKLFPGRTLDPVLVEPPPISTSEEMYEWRKDAQGAHPRSPANLKEPDESVTAAALTHIQLRIAGAAAEAGWYRIGGKVARVINGAGKILGTMKDEFSEPPAVREPDLIICAGAIDYGVPANPVREGKAADIVRPASTAEWLSQNDARTKLGF